MPERFRVFISSPADVPQERLRAHLVIDKLAQEYRRYFLLEIFRWEHEPMLASGTFQDAIDPPSSFDVVVLILWSRLGTALPEKTKLREYRGLDGRTPVTGTEWEFEEALRAAQTKGAPDIVAFRNVSPAPVDTVDLEAQAKSLAQLNALNAFWTRHFADRGVFMAAYDGYRTIEEFAERLEQSLRKLIERRIKSRGLGQQAQGVEIWHDAPFRGLEAYEFEHAPIFFGRDAVVARAAEQLAGRARAGTAFLLISGASGSGKSSLVKGALVPRLVKPQCIEGAAFVRRLVFRPSDGGEDLIRGLIEALTRSPSHEKIGLPELLGPGQTASDFADHLRPMVDSPGFAFKGALARSAEQARASGRILAHEDPKLILVIDQLEELFTLTWVKPENRALFVRFLAGLARSGAVWIVATIRADFWHRVAEIPDLMQLCEGTGRFDVASPSPAELADIICKPAFAGGLQFEVHKETGLALDRVLAERATAAPGVLPLLSFTLESIYAEDVERQGGRVLTHRTYETLGGLEGAIATRADQTVESLPDTAQAAVPRVLRALATVSADAEQAAVSRAVPLDRFPPGSDARAVVDALVAARLLVASSEGAVATVRLAHEALISRWGRAKDQLTADRRDLETRAIIERQHTRWAAAEHHKHQLLLRDPDLANAIDLEKRWGDELPATVRDFIAQSFAAAKVAARRRRAIAAIIMILLAALAVASFGALYVAEMQRNDALIAESGFLARDARTAVADGHATLGIILGLAALPQKIAEPNRPFIKDAEYALEDAYANRRERALFRGHEDTVSAAAFSLDGSRVASASEDKTARIWDAATGREIAVLRGHTAAVSSVAFSVDGKRVVTASEDGTARLWNADTGTEIAVLRGHQGAVPFAAFSPDATRVVTASEDGTARLWDGNTGAPAAVLEGHQGLVNFASFSPDGARVVTAGTDKTARIWDARTGAAVLVLRGHTNFVSSAVFSPDGKYIVTASWDHSARLWDATSGIEIHRRLGTTPQIGSITHEGRVWSATFSPDGTRVMTASADKTARIWQLKTNAVVVLKGHEHWVNSAVFSPDGTRAITASDDHTARLWDVLTGTPLGVMRGHEGLVGLAVFSPDGTRMLTSSADHTARLWSTETDAASFVLRGHEKWATGAAFSPDGKRLVTSSFDTTVRLWDLQTRAVVHVLRGHTDTVWAAVFSSDGKRILSASDDHTARLWDAETGAQLAVFTHPDRLVNASFSPDGSRIATGSTDNMGRVWDIGTGKEIATLKGHSNWVTSAVFSHDGRLVVTASYDDTARVWDAATGAPVMVLRGHEGRVNFASFSPDDSRIVTAAWDGTARVWDAKSGASLLVLKGHDGWVVTAVFSPDARRVLTGAWDGTARLWDAETGAAILALRGHEGRVTAAHFSSDARRVATSSYDTTARIWRLPPHCEALIDAAKEQPLRGPTEQERRKYFLEGQQAKGLRLSVLNRWFAPVLPRAGSKCE